ncbi:MAG: hypothetical protein ACOH5I_21865 [Oligoflexus sp.]
MALEQNVFKRLVIDELHGTLSQEITLTKPTTVERVLPHLYLRGTPTGSLTVSIKSGETTLASKTHTLQALIQASGRSKSHFHGYLAFVLDAPLMLKPGTFVVEVSAFGGYAFEESAFVGWVRLPSKSDQTKPLVYPLDLRMTELRRR